MSQFYEDLAADAKALLQEFGRDITLNRYTDTYNAVTGSNTRVLAATQTLSSAVLPASPGTIQAFDVRFMNDVLDEQNIRFAIMTAVGSTFLPAPMDQAVFDGKTWNVLGCTPLNVDGTAVIYSVGFREA